MSLSYGNAILIVSSIGILPNCRRGLAQKVFAQYTQQCYGARSSYMGNQYESSRPSEMFGRVGDQRRDSKDECGFFPVHDARSSRERSTVCLSSVRIAVR